jgi:pyruvate/2-oxoglutarate dehydrogenase complex dihydrolipoamide acyltransferase (E2) component
LEKEIYVKEGKTLKVGLFKGRFITRLEEEKKVGKQAAADNKEPATKVEAPETSEKQKDLSRWEKFVNGTLKHF